jgi:Leucine-rich repeat (LRR) protein
LTNLENVNVGNNHLQRIPPEIGYLKNLKRLLLVANQLSELPVEIGELRAYP